jgi:hypothetical protein
MVEIDFTYAVVGTAPGDDDLLVTTPNGADSGTLTWLDDGTVFTLLNMNNSDGFSFRFGDEDDDAGHRDFPGLSGWGWMMYDTGPTPGALDWLFTAPDICEPVLPATGACCLGDDGDGGDCVVVDKQTCHDLGGTYQGDGTTCEDDDDDCDDDDHLTGDVTGDGIADFEDLVRVLNAWGTCVECPEDLDGDGEVDLHDLLLLLASWP